MLRPVLLVLVIALLAGCKAKIPGLEEKPYVAKYEPPLFVDAKSAYAIPEQPDTQTAEFDVTLSVPGQPVGLAVKSDEFLMANRVDPWGMIRLKRTSPPSEKFTPFKMMDLYSNPIGGFTSLAWNGTYYVSHCTKGFYNPKDKDVFLIHEPVDLNVIVRRAPAPPFIGGLTWDGNRYYAAMRQNTETSGEGKKLFVMDKDFKVLKTLESPGVGCQGLAWDGRYLWYVDVFSDKISVLDVQGESAKVVRTYHTSLNYLSGIAFDGTHIWIADYGDNKLRRLKGDRTPQKDTPSGAQTVVPSDGLAVDAATIQPGKKFKVRFSGVPGNQQDWITVVSSKASKDTYGEWFYLGGKKEGELEFTAPTQPGSYDIRLYYNWPDGGYEIQKRVQFSLGGATTTPTPAPAAGTTTPPKTIVPSIPKPAAPQPKPPTAVPETYQLNGKTFTNDPLLSATPQTPTITLEAKDQPVESVIAQLAEQTGHEIKSGGFGNNPKNVTLSAKDAPLWAVIGALCEQGGWGFSVYSQPGHPIGIPGGFSHPLRGHQVNGPVLLAWHGLVESDEFDFSQNPPKSVKVTTMILDLMMDPNSNVEIQEPVLNPDFSFVLADGTTVTLKADKEMQDGRGGRSWRFMPKEQLSGKSATLETSVIVWAPTQSGNNQVGWKQGETSSLQNVNLTATSVGQADSEKTVRASFTIGYDKSVLEADQKQLAEILSKVQNEKRDPTPEESRRMHVLQGGGRVLAITNVEIVAKDGTRQKGRVGSSMGSPWTGYNCEATFGVSDGFIPAGLVVHWASANQPIQLNFKLENLPLAKDP
jgi:hypothetical protein